jgi:hypothetical protein
MSDRSKFSIRPVLYLVVFISILAAMGLFAPVVRPIQEKMDGRCLAKFARKIAATDHVVATRWTPYPSRKEMSLSLTGEDVKRVVQAVSSASSGRPPFGTAWANIYSVTATFFKDTNVLGKITIDDGELFKTDGREYRDVSYKPDGDGGSGVLSDLVCAPLGKIVHEAEMKELERQ